LSDDTGYQPGLIFWSKYAGYEYIVRPRKDKFSADGTVIDSTPELVASWATHGGEYNYTDPDGNTDKAADIRGHFFDLDQQAQDKGWSDEDRALVALVLLRNQSRFSAQYELYSAAAIPAPWPTYDKTHHNQVPVLAAQLGLVAESLAYEQQNAKRPSVVEKLQEELGKARVADDLVAA